MVNERLRRAMLRASYDTETLAEAAGVAGKSVQRWIAGDVTPYPRTRYRVAAILAEDESYLWPQAVNHAALAGAELAATWPRRCDVPAHMWTELLRAASRNVDVLAFAGLFLTEGGVFTEDLIETWLDYKRTAELDELRLRPHPHEFELYYDV